MLKRFLSTATATATKTATKTPPPAAATATAATGSVSCLSDACEVIPSEHIKQAPNRESTWSASQRSRDEIIKNDLRFVGKDLSKQPQPFAAIDLIAKVPIMKVAGNIAVCHGTDFEQGHPKVYINLDKPGVHSCGYCGLRYEMDPDHHH